MIKKKVPKLPKLLNTKIYKTGTTRGADDDVIYQNRVSRKSTVLIPFSLWDTVKFPPEEEDSFESGFICLLTPVEYFETKNIQLVLANKGLILGTNALVFYQVRDDWNKFPPEGHGWTPANRRTVPLQGQYIARVAATTSDNGEKISHGFNTTGMKGAGIRLYEYAPTIRIEQSRIQLEAIFWLCHDSIESVTKFSMSEKEAIERRDYCFKKARENNLLNFRRLKKARIVNNDHITICPLCLQPLSSFGFFKRLVQATGREVHDLTVTEINLFHIKEICYGEFNHRIYNLGWGHHHCNVVVKDSGIEETLDWMKGVIARNNDSGHMN